MHNRKYVKKDGTVSTYSYPTNNPSRKKCPKTKSYNDKYRQQKGLLPREQTDEIRYIKKHGETRDGAKATVFEYLCNYYE